MERYEKLYDLVETLCVTLDEIEKSGKNIPCIESNVRMIKTQVQMLAVELDCEKI